MFIIVDDRFQQQSIGTDGIRVWNLQLLQEIQVPQQPYHEKGQVTCTCWITRRNEAFDTLCYGNALGWLVFLQHRPTEVKIYINVIFRKLSFSFIRRVALKLYERRDLQKEGR